MNGDVVAISMILLGELWPVVLILLIVPPFVGYLLDRRRHVADRHQGSARAPK